jgi:hypothetical protein
MKLLRTMRFDSSDERVFELAARPGEWAVSGAFAFANSDPPSIAGKTKQAFANGFLGVASFGRATFATVANAKPQDADEIAFRLAQHFVANYAAPTLEAALVEAQAEVDFVADLVKDALVNTVFTVRRTFDREGRIREEFRTIRPPAGERLHARIWTVVDDET